MAKFAIIENAKRQVRMCFLGIAIPCDKSTADGGTIRSEKVLKFNRKALHKSGKANVEKVNSRLRGGDDHMITKVGKPGSRERVDALVLQYANLSVNEESPFLEND